MAPYQQYIIIVGAGKVGWNLARELLEKGSEVTLIESSRERYLTVEQELEHNIQYGDASELWVLERAGISRADMVIAVTGDDEDNMLICQVAKEKYRVGQIIARVNNPRNRQHFDLLGIKPSVSATDLILRLSIHVLIDIVMANVQVAILVLGRTARLRPAFIVVPLDAEHELATTALISIVSLSPGTLCAELSDDRRALLVHVLDLEEEAALVERIKSRYEVPLKEIFQCLPS